MIYFVGKVGSLEHGNTRSAEDVITVLRELGYRVKVLPVFRSNKLWKRAAFNMVNRLRKYTADLTIVNGLGGMKIYDDGYAALGADVLIVRESPAHFEMKGEDPQTIVRLTARFRKIIFVSSIARSKWEALGLRTSETFYLPNTIRDAVESKNDDTGLSKQVGKLVVLIVASFQYRKAQDVVVDAVLNNEVLRAHYRFVFLGDLSNDYAQSLVRKSAHCDALVFLGKRDAPAYFRKADIVLQPSRAEAMSRVMLEAMKYGKPLICTDIEGSSEAVDSMVNGIVIPPDAPEKMVEALEYLRNNPAKRQAMAEAARVKFETDFAWEQYKRRWKSFMDDNFTTQGKPRA